MVPLKHEFIKVLQLTGHEKYLQQKQAVDFGKIDPLTSLSLFDTLDFHGPILK